MVSGATSGNRGFTKLLFGYDVMPAHAMGPSFISLDGGHASYDFINFLPKEWSERLGRDESS